MPLAISRRTTALVWSLMQLARASDPPESGVPSHARLSLTATGTPWNGPSTIPAARRRSAASASASARSWGTCVNALSPEPRSIRSEKQPGERARVRLACADGMGERQGAAKMQRKLRLRRWGGRGWLLCSRHARSKRQSKGLTDLLGHLHEGHERYHRACEHHEKERLLPADALQPGQQVRRKAAQQRHRKVVGDADADGAHVGRELFPT